MNKVGNQAVFHNLFSLAQKNHQRGDLTMAVNLYREALREIPKHPAALQMLGLAFSQQGNHAKALENLKAALQQTPQDLNLLINTAEASNRAGAYTDAIEYCLQAMHLAPDNENILVKLATAYLQISKVNEALAVLEKITSSNSSNARAYFLSGNCMLALGKYKSAIHYFERAIALQPNHPEAHNNLAISYSEWDRKEEAIKHYQIAIQQKPNFIEAHKNIAQIYEAKGNVKEAKKHFNVICQTNPSDSLMILQRELTFPVIARAQEEIDFYVVNLQKTIGSLSLKSITIDQISEYSLSFPSILNYQLRDLKPLRQEYASLFEEIIPRCVITQQHEKPRIGFVVTQGHEGVFIKCMRGLLNNLPSEKFDWYIICNAPNGESILRPAIQNNNITYVSIPNKLNQALKILESYQFYLLHYWEVGTDHLNYFLPICKPAKLQCTSWGWPVSSGMSTMDYFISNQHLEKEDSESVYTEKIIRFNKLPVYYYKPAVPEEFPTKPPLGIREEGSVYLCTQNLRKVHPEFDQILKDILSKDAKANLYFIEDKDQDVTHLLQQRWDSTLGKELAQRVFFIKRMEEKSYLGLLKIADVILDTTYYGGGANTIYDAFATGTPFVSLVGNYHKERYAYAALKQAGIEGCYVQSKEDYVEKAISIANNRAYRQQLSNLLLSKSDSIFEDKEAIEEHLNFFEEVLLS